MINRLRYGFGKLGRKLGIGFSAEKNVAVQNMLDEIDKLKNRTIVFSLEVDEDGHWAVESKNLPGLITGGDMSDNINDMIIDAIFTYFGVAPEFCDPQVLSEEYANKRHAKEKGAAGQRLIYSFSGIKKATI